MQLPGSADLWNSFVHDACTRSEYVVGLVQAYCSLDRQKRQELVNALLEQQAGHPESVGVLGFSLLSVEEDAALAGSIRQLVESVAPGAVRARGYARARVAGTAAEGSILLSQPLYGSFCEAFGMSWKGDEVTYSSFQPVVHLIQLDECLEEFALPAADWEDVPLRCAWDRLVEVLWKLKQSGRPWPYGLHRFSERIRVA